MTAVELATAYVSLVPSLKGAGAALSEQLGGPASAAGKSAGLGAGLAFGGAMAAAIGGAAVVGGAVASFVGLYKIGSVFDDVTDTIRVGTGAQGAALEGLSEIAKGVATSIPTSFEQAGSTVADLNTRLGLTGSELGVVASQYLEAGRILGEEIDINATTAAFSAFGIEGEAVSGAMDELFQVSQATGVGMNELASSVQKNAPAVQNLGFSFSETAALAGSLDKAGLNTGQVMGALSKSLVTLAKDGQEPQEAFQGVITELEGFIAAGDTASAIDLASTVFGSKGANQLVGAIQSGTLALDDLVGAAGLSGDGILSVAAETADFSESWVVFKNNALSALEPLGTASFNLAGTGMAQVAELAQTLAPAVSSFLTNTLAQIGPALSSVSSTLGPIFSELGASFGPVLADAAFQFSSLGGSLGPLASSALGFLQAFSPLGLIFQVVAPLLPQIVGLFVGLATVLGTTLISVLDSLVTALTPVLETLTTTATQVLGILLPVIVQLASTFGAILADALITLAPILVTIATTLGAVLASALTAVMPLVELLAQLLAAVLPAVLPLVEMALPLLSTVLGVVAPLLELVGALLTPLIGLLVAILTPILALIQPLVGLLAGALGVVIGVLTTVISWVAQGITWFVKLVAGSASASGQINSIWGAIGSFFSGIWNNIVGFFSSGISRVLGFVTGLNSQVVGALRGAGNWLVETGRNIVEGLINGVTNMARRAVDTIVNLGKNMLGGIKDILGVASPSKRMFEVGVFTGQGLELGIRSQARAVQDAVNELVDIPSSATFAPLSLDVSHAATVAAGAEALGVGAAGVGVYIAGDFVTADPAAGRRELERFTTRSRMASTPGGKLRLA
jgi:TP901 family phage tail tape measure protein